MKHCNLSREEILPLLISLGRKTSFGVAEEVSMRFVSSPYNRPIELPYFMVKFRKIVNTVENKIVGRLTANAG